MYESKFAQTGSFKTHYIEAGAGEPVLLIHGGGPGADSRGNWEVCMPLFAAKMHTIAMDMVGFGLSDAPDPATFTYSQDARNDQAIAFIEALGLGPVHIVGNSMGGATAMGVAMKRPDLVRSFVLMGSAGLINDLQDHTGVAKILAYDYTLDGMRKVVKALSNPDTEISEERLKYRHELASDPARVASLKAIMGWVREQGGLFYPEADIASIKHRSLVFAGKDDFVVPMAQNVKFLELLENSTGYFLPHCRHWPMIEYPELFADVVIRFLKPKY